MTIPSLAAMRWQSGINLILAHLALATVGHAAGDVLLLVDLSHIVLSGYQSLLGFPACAGVPLSLNSQLLLQIVAFGSISAMFNPAAAISQVVAGNLGPSQV
jgi:hypothetical protein